MAMIQLRRILCPTDFSPEASLDALDAAGKLASEYAAELFVLHSVNLPPSQIWAFISAIDLETRLDRLKGAARQRLEGLIEREIPDGVTVFPVVRRGYPAAEIVALARERSVDLIVIATHGRTGPKRLLLGSITEEVARHY
jgi:nucleotide-binding universal stress UspA family protein